MVLASQLSCVKGLPNRGARIFTRSPGASMSIYQLVYASRPQTPFDGLRLAALMYRARQHNAHAGISGVLLYSGEMFVQCLEGDRETVEALMRKIEADPGTATSCASTRARSIASATSGTGAWDAPASTASTGCS